MALHHASHSTFLLSCSLLPHTSRSCTQALHTHQRVAVVCAASPLPAVSPSPLQLSHLLLPLPHILHPNCSACDSPLPAPSQVPVSAAVQWLFACRSSQSSFRAHASQCYQIQ